jgi:hypothetical protein
MVDEMICTKVDGAADACTKRKGSASAEILLGLLALPFSGRATAVLLYRPQ